MNLKIKELREQGLSHRQIGRQLGISHHKVRHALHRMGMSGAVKPDDMKEPGIKWEGTEDSVVVSGQINTLEDLLKESKTDLNVWEVERHVVNSWNNYRQVKAWLRKKPDPQVFEALKLDMLSFIDEHRYKAPPRPKLRFKKDEYRNMLEIAVYDIHLGRLAWAEESGQNYDTDIAKKAFEWSVKQHLWKARNDTVEKILFVVGQDFLHYDNAQGTTTMGTPMDADTRWLKIIRTGFSMLVEAILEMSTMAPVEVLIIPGNHDKHSTLALGEMLAAYFKDTNYISIDNSAKLRKYVLYGNVLLGFSHGMHEKPQNILGIMSSQGEASHYWSQSVFREMHMGHFHTKRIVDPLREYNGVVVRYIGSICSPDAWHYEKGFVGNTRSSESFLWNYTSGLSAIYTANLPPEILEA
jgi:hypothetical protein